MALTRRDDTRDEGKVRRQPTRDQWQYIALSDLSRTVAPLLAEFDGRILDYGCGARPYEPFLGSTTSYEGADFAANPQADWVLSDDGGLPEELTGAFDAVVSFQVLEHVGDVATYLAECRRVLKPSGRLLLSTHGIWEFHPAPLDLHRWTMNGLVALIERHGFRVADCVAVTVGLRSVLQQCQILLRSHPIRGHGALKVLINGLADLFRTQSVARDDEARMAIGYVCRADRLG